jgi:hypothetical protein
MRKILTEAQALKQLSIPDFRHLSRDKFMAFASMIPNMDPEVAKKALEQFPHFAQIAIESIKDVKETAVKALDNDKESTARFYNICDEIIEALKASLSADGLSFEEKRFYIEKMSEIAKMASDKDSEGKKFNWSIVAACTTALAVVVGTAVAVLGVINNNNTKD